MKIDYVHFYVDDTQKWRDWFSTKMNFSTVARGYNRHDCTEVIVNGNVVFVLSSPLTPASPVAKYLQLHPCGIADIAFTTSNLASAVQQAVNQGAKMLVAPQRETFPQGSIKWCQIASKSGLRHTLSQREGITPIFPELGVKQVSNANFAGDNFTGIDHVVLNVAAGKLAETVTWYNKALGFQPQQSFKIKTANSGLSSQVMVHPESGTKFPINEPASPNSQIQEFLDVNRGAGIQHIALQTPQIVLTTAQLREAGLTFLP
ncbi:MAG: VOC family protein, partial [Spirulinaceae cyanobacterium]